MWAFRISPFNSTVVRLKLLAYAVYRPAQPDFNSTVVRLKLFSIRADPQDIPEFQFHCGAIKTFWTARKPHPDRRFQFHCGAIKTGVGLEDLVYEGDVRFQFHCGAIKTLQEREVVTLVKYFNSTVVRLKLRGVSKSVPPSKKISIPLWCD